MDRPSRLAAGVAAMLDRRIADKRMYEAKAQHHSQSDSVEIH
jgi:hypothetical protein